MSEQAEAQVRERIIEALRADPARSPKPTLLVVEDDAHVREALEALLGEAYELVGVSTGRNILELIDAYAPALVILDVNLPGRDGFSLCEQLRRSRHRSIPVMFLTGRRDDASLVRFLETGGDALLSKPMEAAEVRDTIERLLCSR
jgi:two-component system, OmpR family, response regulator